MSLEDLSEQMKSVQKSLAELKAMIRQDQQHKRDEERRRREKCW